MTVIKGQLEVIWSGLYKEEVLPVNLMYYYWEIC